jgi:hypothetical protein
MSATQSKSTRHDGFIRLGGAACIAGLAIHILVNEGLKVMPPVDLESAGLRTYLTDEARTWAIVHGLRNLALPCLVVFAAAVFVRTCCLRTSSATGWGVVGLLGSAMQVINAFITNAIETFLLLDADLLAEEPKRFEVLFQLTRFLFTAEIATWAVFILGFSLAGWISRTLPRWIAALGCLSATAGLLSGAFVVSVFMDGPAVVLIDVAALSGLAWFACTAVYLLARGSSIRKGNGESMTIS